VLCHHELFRDVDIRYAVGLRDGSFDLGSRAERERDPLGFLARSWAADLGHTHLGFKMTHRQGDAAPVFDAVVRDTGVCKIVLRRRNRVRTFVSRLVAERTGQWEVYRGEALAPDRPRVVVDADALLASVRQDEAYYLELEQRLAGQRWLGLAYEDLSSVDEHTRLLAFLGLPPAGLEASTVQQNPEDLRELVANFNELVERLRATELGADLGAERVGS
jgi:hypothetical protein